jgi:hypothetical protein
MFININILSLISISVALLFGCNRKEKNSEQPNLIQEGFLCSGEHIIFDSIEHYKITEVEHASIESKNLKTSNDKKMLLITDSFLPNNLLDSIIKSDLLSLGFKTKKISLEDYKHLCDLFQENYQYADSTACSPRFRDLLVFKKQREITGFAKICFQCGHSIVLTKNSIREVDVYRLDALLN